MKFAILFLFTLIVAVPGFAQDDKQKTTKANKPDFSGRWEVDLEKREFMKGMPVTRTRGAPAKDEGTGRKDNSFSTLLIEHRGPELRVVEKRVNSPSVNTEWIYYTDGRRETNTVPGETSVESKTKWDGKMLVTTVFRKSESGKKSNAIIARKTWELSKDGKRLTITRTPLDPEGGPQANTKILWGIAISKTVYKRAQD